ncbi:MAG: prepilin-type N-terminal cleavage/methylation domain-containing protein [Deltaproteobacteria bacterium]|nr:prepilin-type N-terminal cleavage/methylation domain-containing protein [Deltaproteobacteria bacterium]
MTPEISDRQAKTRPRAARRGGFTLVELALVLLITSILLTLVLPRLPRLGAAQLDASADRLAAIATYLADESSLRGRIYRLTIDLDENAWEVEALRPWDAPDDAAQATTPQQPREEWDPYGRSGTLPAGVFFESFTGDDGEQSSGRQSIWFLPEGAPEDVRVALGEDGGRRSDVLFDAGAGRARVLAQRTEP